MSYNIQYTGSFKKDYKRILKRGFNIELLNNAFEILIKTGTLPAAKYKIHPLKGNYAGYYDSHITPDWIIIWKTDIKTNTITLTRTGSHSDLF